MPDVAELRAAIIAQARARLGIPYALPPSPPESTDCSLYVRDVFEAAGLPFSPGVRVAEQERQDTVPIDFAEVLPGDLLFFEGTYDAGPPSVDGHIASHIGISLGAGTHRMLNAVEPVSTETNIATPYWQAHILEARRHPALAGITTPQEPPMPPVTTLPRGVDVASYQGRPDWAAVAASGIAFAWTKATQGTDYTNPTYTYNWAGIKGNGMVRGAYHFGTPNRSGPEAEAEYFLETVGAQGLETGDLLALDLEEYDGSLSRGGDIPDWTIRWLRHVEQLAGYKPMIYTARNVVEQYNLASIPEIGQYGLWLASWGANLPAAPDPWPFVACWQYSDSETVPGINGKVDGDKFNLAAERIVLYGKPAGVPALPADPPPPPHEPLDWRAELEAILATHDESAALAAEIRAWLARVPA